MIREGKDSLLCEEVSTALESLRWHSLFKAKKLWHPPRQESTRIHRQHQQDCVFRSPSFLQGRPRVVVFRGWPISGYRAWDMRASACSQLEEDPNGHATRFSSSPPSAARLLVLQNRGTGAREWGGGGNRGVFLVCACEYIFWGRCWLPCLEKSCYLLPTSRRETDLEFISSFVPCPGIISIPLEKLPLWYAYYVT